MQKSETKCGPPRRLSKNELASLQLECFAVNHSPLTKIAEKTAPSLAAPAYFTYALLESILSAIDVIRDR
jgi:hypothetical protein